MFNSCFETGGPDWLFALLLGSTMAAVGAFMAASASPSEVARRQPAIYDSGWFRLLLTGLLVWFLDIDTQSILALAGPPAIVLALHYMSRRNLRTRAPSDPMPMAPAARQALRLLGIVWIITAVGSLVAMIVTGERC